MVSFIPVKDEFHRCNFEQRNTIFIFYPCVRLPEEQVYENETSFSR